MRRHNQKNEIESRFGFIAFSMYYQRFYNKKPTLDNFIDSKLYNDFIRFGFFMKDINQDLRIKIHVDAYVDFLIKENVKIRDWEKKSTFKKFIKFKIIKTDPYESFKNTLEFILDYTDKENYVYTDYFRNITTNEFILHLSLGFVSPWIVFSCTSGVDLFKELNDDELKIISDTLDIQQWKTKISINKDIVAEFKKTLSNVGF
jgi:hypothetical protein